MDVNDRRILVTGALGQIGSELVPALRARVGPARVVTSDIRMPRPDSPLRGCEKIVCRGSPIDHEYAILAP